MAQQGIMKFSKGDRVQLSKKWLDNGFGRKQRFGTVVGFGIDWPSVWVNFDNTVSKQSYHEDFLEFIPRHLSQKDTTNLLLEAEYEMMNHYEQIELKKSPLF